MVGRDHSRFVKALVVASLVFAAVAVVIGITGGFHLPLGVFAISSRKASRPAALAVMLAALALWLVGADARRGVTTSIWAQLQWLALATRRAGRFLPSASACALALSLWAGFAAWTYGSQTAGGSDAFAYLSQAALIRTGRMDIPVPLATRAPWPNAAESFAPLGYRARSDSRAVVPITAPGVPIVMAAFQLIGGHRAAFLVTPLAAALAVWLTFLIGRTVRSAGTGLAASWLVATSPAFLFNMMWPMSDIASAMWAALMVWLLLRGSAASALAAGLAGSMGLLTRPNFMLIDAAAFGWLLVIALAFRDRNSLTRCALFIAGLVPGELVQAALNLRWFDRVFASGYGSAEGLLSLTRASANAGRYASWLAETSPILFVGLIAMFIPVMWLWGRTPWRIPLLFAAISAGTVSVYLVYTSFNDWWYLRFLLPIWPVAAVATGVLATALWSWSRVAGSVAAIAILIAGTQGFALAKERGVFSFGEHRYATVAALVAAATEPNAVVFTVSHSGSVRYYAGRETIRFDWIEAAWLDRAIEWLVARGRKPYILVEDWELPDFRARFGPASETGKLSFVPAATWESSQIAGRVFLYDPIDRDRFATADPGAVLERNQPRAAPSRFPKLAFE